MDAPDAQGDESEEDDDTEDGTITYGSSEQEELLAVDRREKARAGYH